MLRRGKLFVMIIRQLLSGSPYLYHLCGLTMASSGWSMSLPGISCGNVSLFQLAWLKKKKKQLRILSVRSSTHHLRSSSCAQPPDGKWKEITLPGLGLVQVLAVAELLRPWEYGQKRKSPVGFKWCLVHSNVACSQNKQMGPVNV